MPTFFRYLYIFLIFFLRVNKKKKWESGQRALKPSDCNGFSLPTFILKVGKSPLFLAKSGHELENLHTIFTKAQIKVGKSPLSQLKSGQKFYCFSLQNISSYSISTGLYSNHQPPVKITQTTSVNRSNRWRFITFSFTYWTIS